LGPLKRHPRMFSSPLQVPSPGFPIEAMRLITARIGKLMAMMPSK